MTKSQSHSHRDMSIEALRQRVSAVESRFLRIDDENVDYRRRLNDLMAALDEDQNLRREETEALEKRIESVVAENNQLREILDEVLTAAESFGDGRPDETLADLASRVGGREGSKNLLSEAAERIGVARAAAEEGTIVASDTAAADESKADEPAAGEPEEAEAILTLKPAKKNGPGSMTGTDGEPDAPAMETGNAEPNGAIRTAEAPTEVGETAEAGADAVETAADEASEDDVLELETEAPRPAVEIIEPERPKAKVEVQPEAKVIEPLPTDKPAEKSAEAAKDEKAKEMTTDKETDQLDRILASIRRITSAL